MKPVQVPNLTITKMIDDDCDWNEIANKARELANVDTLSKLKHAMKKQVNPYGHSFDAVTRLRGKGQRKRSFLHILQQ